MNFSKSHRLILFLGLLCLQFSPFVTAQSSCNCAAFRLDNVQDYWLTSVQQAIMQAFIDTNTSLTVGILGDAFGQDMEHVHFMRDQTVRNPTTPLEIACNGWQGEDFTTFDLTTQTSLLQTATRTIERFLWAPPIKVFIPPGGKYNTNTLTAMRNRNMTHISSFSSLDGVRPYSLTGQSVYRFPTNAGMQSISNPAIGITASQSYTQITSGITKDGFSVVLLDVMAFAQKSGGQAIDAVNQTMITELKNLLTMTKSGGYSIVPISKINLDAPTTKPAVNYTDIYTCNCVAFRLDDIQDFYMSNQQYALMNAFLDNQAAVTLGIIANNFGSDASLVSFISSKAADPTNKWEIANHGLYHEDFSTLSETESISRLNQAQGIIRTSTGITPTTLLLPYNTFNNDTLGAIKTVGFSGFSSSIDIDQALYDMNHPDLWHYPCGAQTSNTNNDAYFEYWPSNLVYRDIQLQLDRDGFAVVMVHPQEFSMRNSSNDYTQVLNQTALNDFITLIQTIKSAGIQIVPVGSIGTYMTPMSAAPSPVPSASPSAQPSASPSAVPSSSPSSQPLPSSSPAASKQPSVVPSGVPSSSPVTSQGASSSPAASRPPSPSSGTSARDTGGDVMSSSGKVEPFGMLSILALVIAAIVAAQ